MTDGPACIQPIPRGLVLAAFLLFAAGPVAADEAPSDAPEPRAAALGGPLREIAQELERIRDETAPLLDRLDALREEYERAPGAPPDSALRKELLDEIMPRFTSYATTLDDFNRVRSEAEAAEIRSGVLQFMAKKRLPRNVGRRFAAAKGALDMERSFRKFRHEAFARMMTEDAAYKRAVQSAEAARLRRLAVEERAARLRLLAVGGVALSVVVVAPLGYLTWRRRARTAELVYAGSAPGALPGRAAPALPGPGPALTPGSVLGENFRIEKELGRGGMGVVYEATDLSLRRKVAIKRMLDELTRSKDDLEQFMREARLVASLKHGNLVEIYSILREAGQVFLVFEHVRGKTLGELLAGGRRVSLRSTKSLIVQACAALDYAHGCKVIHRDLKPSNIMITPEGVVKVMDFGVAHRAKMTVARITRTQAWGTPAYMAPEQELGEVCRESDIFALGVCLYEMLTGKIPYGGPNFLAQKQRGLYAPPTKTTPGLPRQTDAVVRRALQADPGQRFHSGREFAAALAAVPEPA
ncbi:MAG: protein kinase [Elusimicrobiota bacterium]